MKFELNKPIERRGTMIIHSNEILEAMKTKEQVIEVTIPTNFTPTLKSVTSAIDELNHKNTENTELREQSFIAERKIQTALIKEKTNGKPLFDLSVLGYTNIEVDSLQYLYTPKDELVGNYIVDLLTTYFNYEDDEREYQVLMPLYLVQTDDEIVLLPIQGENQLVQASIGKIKKI